MDRAKIRELEERVSQFQLLRLPEQPEVMHMGTSDLVADLLKTVRDLARELEAKERIVESIVDALAPILEANKAVTPSSLPG
jgi:CHASE2 domain-containing sensor protein